MILEKNENYSVLFQVHLFFTIFLFLLFPHIANHFMPDISESALLTLALLNGLVGITLCVAEGRILMPFKPALIFFYLFCIFVLLHYFFGNKSEEGRMFVNGITLIMLFTFNLSQACRSKKIALLLISAVIVNGLLQIIIGLNQHYYSLPELEALIAKNPQLIQEYGQSSNDVRFLERINGRLSFGSFIYPNTLGAYLGLFLFALVGFYILIKDRAIASTLKWVLLILGASALFCILFTGAKGVWISLMVVSILALVLLVAQKIYKKLSHQFYIIWGSCLLIGAVCSTFLLKNMLSMKVRLDYWRAGWDMFVHESTYGWGLGAGGFTNYYLKYKMPFGEEVQKAHNYFVTVFVEQGVIGFVLFVLFLFSLFYWFLKNKPSVNIVNNSDDSAMPNRVYLFLFYFVFVVFMMMNPNISDEFKEVSILTLYVLIVLFLIVSVRFFVHKNVFKVLPFEQVLPFQILLLSSSLVICFIDLVNAVLRIENWPNFGELNGRFPAIVIVIFIFLFFIFILNKNQVKKNISSNEKFGAKELGLLVTVFFILMIGGDMVGEYSSFVVTFLALAFIFEKINFIESAEIKLPNYTSIVLFVFLSFGFLFYLFERVILVDISIARYHYLIDHWELKNPSNKNDQLETKIIILESGQKIFPGHMYFPLEKAKIYSSIGGKYSRAGFKQNAFQWNTMAIKEIELCIKISPFKANLYDFKADLMAEMGEDIDKIEVVRLKALENYPTKAYYHYKLAVFYKKAEKVESAFKYFKSAIYLQTNSNRYTILNKEEYEEAVRYTVENESKTDYNPKSE